MAQQVDSNGAAVEARGSKDFAHDHRLEGRISQAFTAPHRMVLFVGALLCCCAGMVNVISVMELGSFVSHVSGTVSRIGQRTQGVMVGDAAASQALEPLGVVASFVFGAALCGLSAGKDDLNEVHVGKRLYGLAMIGESAILVAAMLLVNSPVPLTARFLAAAACGLQNGMCTMHFGAIVRTTHVTGLATDLGTHLGRLLAVVWRTGLGKPDEFDRAERDVVTAKLRVYVLLGSNFLIGSFFGAWLVEWLGVYALAVPASITFIIGCAYLCFRDALKYKYAQATSPERQCDGKPSEIHVLLKRTAKYLDEAQLAAPSDLELGHLTGFLRNIEARVATRFPQATTC